VVVGSRIVLPSDGGTYGFYYVFPMDEEQRTLSLVERSLLTSGALLLLLTAGIVLLVTRQVITPVRLARRVAERIASGRLEERMHVHGEDDIARLATSFNQMTDALQQQIRQLVELSRVQRQFVSDVSHELRTPLTTVRMAGDVLHDSRGSFEPVAARAAELLQNELDRFENLLADLLEISRFDAGAAGLELTEVNLADVAHRVVDRSTALARQRGVSLVVETPEPCVAEVDERRIERVLRNLVSNAIDHANVRGDARVVVRVAGDAQAVAVTVRDYGVGLQPGQSAMVFNRFWRGDPARARSTGGTGLGLAISLEDDQLHGGWLQVWGAPDAGAQFRLTVPRRAGDPLGHSPLPLVPDDAGPTPGDAATGATPSPLPGTSPTTHGVGGGR
jgi:two-component system sensor histidine kinase MtrB